MTDLLERAIFIVVDALSPKSITPQNTPHLFNLIKKGLYVKDCRTVFPSITLPCISSLVTGTYPEKHGIIGDFYDKKLGKKIELLRSERWDKDFLDIETIFDHAKKKGLKSCAITGYAVGSICGKGADILIDPVQVRYYDYRIVPWSEEVLTPLPGWIKERLKGKYEPYETEDGDDLGGLKLNTNFLECPEKWIIETAIKALKEEKPEIMMLHLPSLDLMQHIYGFNSPETLKALHDVDTQITRLYTWLKENNLLKETLFIITADHGASEVHNYVDLDAELKADGEVGDKTIVIPNGTSYFLWIKKDADKEKTKEAILKKLRSMHQAFDVIATKEEDAQRYHLPKDIIGEIFTSCSPGWAPISPAIVGHGSLIEDHMKIFLLLIGGEIKPNQSEKQAKIIDIAPTIAKILGLKYPKTFQGNPIKA